MSLLRWRATLPKLQAPIMVTAFRGWFDAGAAATGALEWLEEHGPSRYVADFDPEELFNFTQHRPMVELVKGRREISWPPIGVIALPSGGTGTDLLMVLGMEPHLRWSGFADTLVELAEESQASMLVTMGAHIADIPHTRPFTVTGSTSDARIAKAWRLDAPSYEGPTGIVGVLHERFEWLGLPAVSLRVAVPHYVSSGPNPKGSRALLERFERVTGLPTGWADLDEAAQQWEERVNEAMNSDEEVVEYVRHLEARVDASVESSVPSPEDIGAEFERLLRRQEGAQ